MYEPADDNGTDNITTKYEYNLDDRVTNYCTCGKSCTFVWSI